MSIYLDHTATARPTPGVIACLAGALSEYYANPSSMHKLGRESARLLRQARADCAAVLGCQPEHLLLTSGGTESINLAIKGYVCANPRAGRRIITSLGEHAATRETLNSLEKQGYEIIRLPLLKEGTVDLASLEAAMTQPVALITLIHVSNETGAVNPISEIVRIRNQLGPATAIHFDTVQTTGKLDFHFGHSGVDMVSGSGHKIGAPKGIGWLIHGAKIRLEAQIQGGGQQDGLRSGTENPPMVMTLAYALDEAVSRLPEKIQETTWLRRCFLDDLQQAGLEHVVLSPQTGVPHILAVSFPGLRGETLLHALEARDISISTGSACSSRQSRKGNSVLRAMGISDVIAACAVRISFAAANQENEIHTAAQAIAEICHHLRR